MKKIIFILGFIFIASCQNGNPGDGRETGADKHEWSILQNLEYSFRDKNNIKFSIIKKYDYSIVMLPNSGDNGAIFIMLNPKSAPFYKQMPNQQFSLTESQFNVIIRDKSVISTVEEALRSHLKDENT
jgi:hypothetical protein